MRSFQTFVLESVPTLGDLPTDDPIGSVRFVHSEGKRYLCVAKNLDIRYQWKEWDGSTIGSGASI